MGAALGATAALREAADRKLFVLVGFAREAGASWASIGEALGVTTQAAHQRFGPRHGVVEGGRQRLLGRPTPTTRFGAVILSDRSIREALAAGRIQLEPTDDALVQPASVDVRLDRYFRVFLNHTMPVIDVRKNLEELTRLVEIDDDRPFVLHPGEFVLGSTLERVALPDDLVARIEGKSSLGRLGLLIHSTAGFIDAGFDGHITLELSNVANLPITLYPGMKIGQISFLRMTTPADVPYGKGALGSKYQGQRGPTPSRYWENFDSE